MGSKADVQNTRMDVASLPETPDVTIVLLGAERAHVAVSELAARGTADAEAPGPTASADPAASRSSARARPGR